MEINHRNLAGIGLPERVEIDESHSQFTNGKLRLLSSRPNLHQDISPRAFSSRRLCPPGPERCEASHDENGLARDTAELIKSSVAVMFE